MKDLIEVLDSRSSRRTALYDCMVAMDWSQVGLILSFSNIRLWLSMEILPEGSQDNYIAIRYFDLN